jgi:hypothetical protein
VELYLSSPLHLRGTVTRTSIRDSDDTPIGAELSAKPNVIHFRRLGNGISSRTPRICPVRISMELGGGGHCNKSFSLSTSVYPAHSHSKHAVTFLVTGMF